jgi:type III restriction enzyme
MKSFNKNFELKNYQEKAVEDLKKGVNELLELGGENKLCIFEAPTGSGKTIMMGEFLKRLVNPIDREDGKTFSFIWISVRDLDNQSKRSMEKNYENCFIYSDFKDIQDKKIQRDEILFLNWESINNEDKIYIKDNESGKNLSNIIYNTKAEGRELVLVIDESHHTAISENSTRIKNDIGAKVTVEVSATPVFKSPDAHIKVHFEKVVAEGMIKNEIVINPAFEKFKIDGKSSREMVIDAAISKRNELSAMFKSEGTDINPLVLIQLPNLQKGINDLDKDVLTEVEKILKTKFDISEENEKLARWLSDDKTPNLINIEKDNNQVEVLIFKQAIALGWDCPRAHILVIFRETKDKTFLIQTVGRIMRMPEAHHYEDNLELNKGFVFTNLGDTEIKIEGDIAKEYIMTKESLRDAKKYKNIDLPSIHFKRNREKTRLSGEFSNIFLKIAKEKDLKGKIDKNVSNISKELVIDGSIINIDKVKRLEMATTSYTSPDTEIQTYYDLFCKASTGEFAPIDSMGRIKSALNKFFVKELGFDNDDPAFYRIVLSINNIDKFKEILALAREEYKRTIVEVEKEREVELVIWNVPKVLYLNSNYQKKNYKKSIMQPYYSRIRGAGSSDGDQEDDSQVESDFISYLENNKRVEWWFKNGSGEISYFAVKYIDKYGKLSAFYVDFIAHLGEGKIGLFDTKDGRTAEDAKERAEALIKYVKEQNKQKKNLTGGIVIPSKDGWRINHNDKYIYNPKDFKDWDFLDSYLN